MTVPYSVPYSTAWAWGFGDGGKDTVKDPSHKYAATGTYDVSLTVTTAAGTNTKKKTGYITATARGCFGGSKDLAAPSVAFKGAGGDIALLAVAGALLMVCGRNSKKK